MRISLLQQREPFDQILEKTMSQYWSRTLRKDIEVHLGNDEKTLVSKTYFYCNIYLNNFAQIDTPSKIFEVIRKEYSRSNWLILRPIQWLYVTLATTPYIFSLFAQKKLIVFPKIEQQDFLLLGGNNRLRILKPIELKSIIILKAGFLRLFIENEIELRSKYNIDLAPKFLNYSKKEGWIEEEYTPGMPINRLGNETLQKQLEAQAVKDFAEQVIKPSIKQVNAIIHLQHKCESLKSYITNQFSTNDFETLLLLLDNVWNLVSTLPLEENTWVSWSHGDFQVANILLQETKEIVVIDWEAAAIRSVLYDFIVLKYHVRYTNDYIQVIKDLLTDESISHFVNSIHPEIVILKKTLILHFLIDELAYQLYSNCQKVFFHPYNEMKNKMTAIQEVISFLKTTIHF